MKTWVLMSATRSQAMSLWDEGLFVAPSAENVESCFRCVLVDENGPGARSANSALEPLLGSGRRGDGKAGRLVLVAPLGGAR